MIATTVLNKPRDWLAGAWQHARTLYKHANHIRRYTHVDTEHDTEGEAQ